MNKLKKRRTAEILFLAVALFLGAAIYFVVPFFITSPKVDESVSIFSTASHEGKSWRKIDGAPVPFGKENSPVYAVVIENHPNARPLSGLARASLVYEAPVEGGLTRFLAIFSADERVSEIGPVRSARPYFVDLATEFGGIFAHVGGSDAALALLDKERGKLVDLNQYYKSEYFWRDGGRFAPHNVYTNSENLALADQKLNLNPLLFDGWQFKEDAPLPSRPEKEEVKVSSPLKSYEVKWVYDRIHNSYVRYEGGETQKDNNGPVVRAKNIVILKTDIEIIDAVTRRAIQTAGAGEATVFRDGETIPARWKRPDAKSRLKFYDADGAEISFNAGQTWIEIVSK
jgi:hypothetical protein